MNTRWSYEIYECSAFLHLHFACDGNWQAQKFPIDLKKMPNYFKYLKQIIIFESNSVNPVHATKTSDIYAKI